MTEPTIGVNKPKQLTPKEKLIASLLALSGVLVFSFWYINFQKTLMYMPLGGVDPKTLAESNKISSSTLAINENKDTDKDGLLDVQEINIYKTSSYLPDTDGDGISDYDEIHNGTDPLCSEGKGCSQGGLYSSGVEINASSTSAIIAPINPTANVSQTDILKQAFGENPDPKVLRQSLIANSPESDKANLNALTDEQLLQAYKSMVNGITSNVNSLNSTK